MVILYKTKKGKQDELIRVSGRRINTKLWFISAKLTQGKIYGTTITTAAIIIRQCPY